jgi:archaemetzincin
MRIVVQPLGDVPAHVLDEASRVLESTYRVPVEIAESRALISAAYDGSRDQYRAARLLEQLVSLRPPDACVLGITPADVYEPGTNFLFGLGSAVQHAALVATARFEIDRQADRGAERAAKAAVHELGHAIGLGHCQVPRCVMLYSNDLPSFDRKSLVLCTSHQATADELAARDSSNHPTPPPHR